MYSSASQVVHTAAMMFPNIALASRTNAAQLDPHQFARVARRLLCRLSIQTGGTIARQNKKES